MKAVQFLGVDHLAVTEIDTPRIGVPRSGTAAAWPRIRARSDYMGMLGTVMNCLALQDFLEKAGVRFSSADGNHHGNRSRQAVPSRFAHVGTFLRRGA